MRSIIQPIFIDILSMTILMLLVPVATYLDIVYFNNGLSENSITEFIQSIFLLLSSFLFFHKASRNIESKGLWIIVGAVFFMMFIREQDYYLDTIYHGFWKVPLMFVLALSIYISLKNKGTIFNNLIFHYEQSKFTYIVIGFMVLIVFSRTFGTGHIWKEFMGVSYQHLYKSIIQEGLELLGYSLIFYGSLWTCFLQKNSEDKPNISFSKN